MSFTYPKQAASIFLFLRKIAAERQVVSYGDTAVAIGRTASEGRLIAPALQILHEWCCLNNRPAITALVVKEDTSEVGEWLASRIPDPVRERQKVCDHDWSTNLPLLSDLQAIKLK